jgi:succinate dehydrogenase/fumarate reductase cytochrome b subunit
MTDGKEDPKAGLALSDGPVRNPDITKIRKEQERGYLRPWLSHTLSRKNLMALTGLFLCFFLVIHLFGDLQLLLPAEAARWQFDFYSKLLSENLFLQLISYVLLASILAHAFYALLITLKIGERTENVMNTTGGASAVDGILATWVARHYHSCFPRYSLTRLLVPVTVWWPGEGMAPLLHREPLRFDFVTPSVRSYK